LLGTEQNTACDTAVLPLSTPRCDRLDCLV
jgi:hypothetical protein